jgi:flagellin-like hook-associated protein FlgL
MIQNLAKNADRPLEPEKIIRFHKKIKVIPPKYSAADKSPRTEGKLEKQDRFLKNITLAKFWLKETHSILSQVDDLILKAKRIAIQMLEKSFNHEARKQAAKEVEKLFDNILKIANIPKNACPFPPKADPPLADMVNSSGQDARKHVFAFDQTILSFFRNEEGESLYPGDSEEIELTIQPGLNMRINWVDLNFLTKPLKTLGEDFNLDPGIDQNTRLSDLNGGRGVNLGSIRITDSKAGKFWDIDLHHTASVGDVINAINSFGIAGLNADIGTSKKGLKLTYTGLNASKSGQEFTVSEISGTPAKDLGILSNPLGHSANQIGNLEGKDLNPILTQNTPVSLLKGGYGLTLGSIQIALGSTQKTVDLSSASTVGEIIDVINSAIPGVFASLNNSKKGINIEATVVGQSLMVSDGDDKRSASDLGISESADMLGGLLFLREALNNDDSEAISKSLEILDLSLEEVSSHKAETEAKLKRLENIGTRIMGFQSDAIWLLSEVGEVELFRAITNLENQQSIYQSALQSGAAVIQPTLLNFIR